MKCAKHRTVRFARCIASNVRTKSIQSQLVAHHIGIERVPPIVTHRPPSPVDTHLHTTCVLCVSAHQTNVSVRTVGVNVCRKQQYTYLSS